MDRKSIPKKEKKEFNYEFLRLCDLNIFGLEGIYSGSGNMPQNKHWKMIRWLNNNEHACYFVV